MASLADLKTPDAALVEESLRGAFPQATAYRYNSASIRVRVIDERFRGKSLSEREKLVRPLLETLPEEIRADLTILLLLPPEEVERSMMNLEFEHPEPSVL